MIRAYIMPSKATCVLAWILLAATVAFLIVGGVTSASEKKQSADASVAFTMDTVTYQNAYIDVVGVSDWLCRDGEDTYYGVEDANGQVYTVKLSNSQWKNMSALRDYWDRADDSVPMPEPYRLYGVAVRAGSDVLKTLAEVYGVTTEEYKAYVGTLMLDTIRSSGSDDSAMWFVFAMMSGMFSLVFWLLVWAYESRAKKSLNRLEELGLLERAAQYVQTNTGVIVGKDQAKLTDQFIFGHRTGVVAAISDIAWAYPRVQRTNFITTGTSLVVHTRGKKELIVFMAPFGDKQELVKSSLLYIAERNPNVILGYDRDKASAYKQMCKSGM